MSGGPVSIRDELERRLALIPGLSRRRSRYGDGYSFFLADREVAHFHGDTRLDVRLTRRRLQEMRQEGPIDPRVEQRARPTEWVSVRMTVPSDVEFAVGLVEEAVRANA